jgi:sialate O-acetylesterase
VRDKQLKNLAIPHTAMVVAIDNADDPANIHPKNKQAIGLRLALAAEAIVYGEKIPYSGPIYDKMNIEGNAIRLQFTHTDGGLVTKDNKAIGFAIAGADKKFVWANAVIKKDIIEVWSPQVKQPVAVRYAWADNPEGANLYNKDGLPAPSFRTDQW